MNPRSFFIAACALSSASTVYANTDTATLEPIVVTATPMRDPLTIITDAKAPRQPLPAADGAGLLKSIPGFSVTRKGGSGGDPLLRGLGAGRLNILIDGSSAFGGCGMRMDPPTAYIYPDMFDRVVVSKGPQSVQHGPVPLAGSVSFERDTPTFTGPSVSGDISATVASFDRNDQSLNLLAGSELGWIRLSGQRNESGDYRDGEGVRVNSAARRHSAAATVGWTPDSQTLLEFSYDWSRGEGAYADRMMDGAKFDRDAWQIKAERRQITPWLNKVSASYYHSYVDHVMDNFSLRRPPAMKSAWALSNPDREVEGAKVDAELSFDQLTLNLGADIQHDWHTARSGVNYQQQARTPDMRFSRQGIYLEGKYTLSEQSRILAGWRVDQHEATDQRANSASKTAGVTDRDTLHGGFIRFEQQTTPQWLWFAGVGYTERAADYWERTKGNNAFLLNPEKQTQLDLGLSWRQGDWRANASVFYAKIDDFILAQYPNAPHFSMASAANIDATRLGGEADISWRFAKHWQAQASVAYVYGRNDSSGRPLAQTPPLEGRLAIDYDDGVFSAGASVRAVARQTRLDPTRGNVFNMDLSTPAAGFSTVSLYGGWKPEKSLSLIAGVDNLFDRSYAEPISRGMPGGMAQPAGYEQTLRVNEPGRTWWLKGRYQF